MELHALLGQAALDAALGIDAACTDRGSNKYFDWAELLVLTVTAGEPSDVVDL